MNSKSSDTVDFANLSEFTRKFDCICNRNLSDLICIECKRQIYGRLYKPCEKHPLVSKAYLIDQIDRILSIPS